MSCAAGEPKIFSKASANAAGSVLTAFFDIPKLRSRQLKSALWTGSPSVAKAVVTACWKEASKAGVCVRGLGGSRVIWTGDCWVVCCSMFVHLVYLCCTVYLLSSDTHHVSHVLIYHLFSALIYYENRYMSVIVHIEGNMRDAWIREGT